ncbi:hypothetical protein L1987_27698 [Smallanthus sonchifolius]|uniref:Uncharacterized protein n=1 Tax=Smallanthus sonchifolius TaxID=185202 RepID=A0ACB9IDA0_9ASTR|nr:hypothetical protein L1987_27698 [Smallanthus sonchifolius]
MVRDVEVQGWTSTDSHDFTFFLSNGSSLTINIKEILLLPSAFLHRVFELRSLIFNVNSLESQEMIKIIKASLYKEEYGSDSDLSFLPSLTVRLNTEEESKRREEEKMKEAWKDVTSMEWEEDELDELKVKIPAVYQIEEDEALALQLQEQFDKEEEELEKKKKEEAKFRITDSELAKEMREEWVKALVSQGEDADYLEKLSNKEIYRAFMGQQGQLAKKKKAEEEEKAKQKSKKTIAFNKWTHEERKIMIDFLKAIGESGKRLGPMNFMNLQALYFKVKKDEEERLEKKGSKKRVNIQEEERKSRNPSLLSHLTLPQSNNLPLSFLDLPPLIPQRGGPKLKDQSIPDSNLRRMMELGESSEPENEGGRHLLLAIRHYFNPSKDKIIDAKSLQSHSPFISWSYNAEKNEFTLTDVKGQNMRCSSKAIFKMASKDIKTLSELPLNNPSMDQRGYEVERIASQQHQHFMLLTGKSSAALDGHILLLTSVCLEDKSLQLTIHAKRH